MLALLAALAVALQVAPQVACAQGAQAYPSRPIRIVVAFPPGGSNDIMARVSAQHLSLAWNQPVLVENRPGANTIIAAELVAKAPADGYTLLVGASSTYTINPAAYAKLPYDPVRDLAPVAMMGSTPLVVAVHPSLPANSLREFIALAKSRPGEINSGTPTITFHVAVESFSQLAGIRMTRVPYKGSIPTITGLLANDVQFVFMDAPPIVPHVKAGKLRALAVTTAKRLASLPDVPTVAESGFPGYDLALWNGVFAPAGTPRDIIAKLNAEVTRAMNAPENRERFATLGLDPHSLSPEEFAAALQAETARYAKVIREGKITAE
ncbi:MAG: tripartite tricarboxylate transporter substrate binding protein [Betaproteobacteria bacterium]|nr:tripartite tricarboxylate transporter substrate binding protein [Betaproteobacteria bacterium]